MNKIKSGTDINLVVYNSQLKINEEYEIVNVRQLIIVGLECVWFDYGRITIQLNPIDNIEVDVRPFGLEKRNEWILSIVKRDEY